MRAALIIAANNRLTHHPAATSECFSPGGVLGSETSNITLQTFSFSPRLTPELVATASIADQNVVDWLTDVNNVTADGIGHRRWLLNPFLRKIAYGRVIYRPDKNHLVIGSAIRVIFPGLPPPISTETIVDTVAYPWHDYPAAYYAPGAWLSLSILADRGDVSASRTVDFSAARVKMNLRDGTPIPVRESRFDNLGAGLPNSIQFRGDDLLEEQSYYVTVSGVRINGRPRDYSYWFRLSR